MSDDDSNGPATPLTPEQRQLANDHLELVVEQARFLGPKYNRISHDELVSLGYSGLVRAAKSFDPKRNVPFKQYARHRIRGHIIDQVRLLSRYSERQQDLRKQVRRAEEELNARRALQKELTKSTIDLIDFLGDNPLPEAVNIEGVRDEIQSRDSSPETAIHRARIRQRVREALDDLETDVRSLMSQIYYHDKNQQAAADHLGFGKSRASKLHAKGRKLILALFRRDS